MTTHNVQHDLGREKQELDRYLKARMEWDDRYGSARMQALNWRYLSFFLLGLLMLRLATHPIFLAPAFIWCLLGGYQLLLRHHHRFMLARPSL